MNLNTDSYTMSEVSFSLGPVYWIAATVASIVLIVAGILVMKKVNKKSSENKDAEGTNDYSGVSLTDMLVFVPVIALIVVLLMAIPTTTAANNRTAFAEASDVKVAELGIADLVASGGLFSSKVSSCTKNFKPSSADLFWKKDGKTHSGSIVATKSGTECTYEFVSASEKD